MSTQELRAIEAKYLSAQEVACYVGDELVTTVPREMAVNAILSGQARLLNPGAIQQIPRTADELEHLNRENARQANTKYMTEYSRVNGSMRG